ncbi:TPA: DUF3173 family protein [Streptococcus suis]|nr:DUF3173 family protein [Streptococcus suis]HEM5489760.1 DUF3173 family protein [Streptococcus suis]
MKTISHHELMALGFNKSAARRIIREAKAIAIQEFEQTCKFDKSAVKLSKSPFDNRRLDLAPLSIVESLLGFQIFDKES